MGFLKKHPTLSIPAAMKLADFEPDEISCRAKYQWVYRELNKKGRSNLHSPFPEAVSIPATSPNSNQQTLSSLSDQLFDDVREEGESHKKIRTRDTAQATQKNRLAKMQEKKEYNRWFKRGTALYAREKEKKDGLSARQCCELIKTQTGGKVKISARTLQDKVKKGEIGVSPLRRGPKNEMDDLKYKNLCLAFETFVVINQTNNNGNARLRNYKIGNLLQNIVYGKAAAGTSQAHNLLQRVLRDTATNLKANKLKNAEDQRIRWTNYKNISLWFDNWESDLVELGTAKQDSISSKVIVPPDQLRNIINLDETALSLDGSTNNRGGRPQMVLYDPRFPQVGRETSKSSYSTTLITGSNAAGEALPPHI